MDVHSDELPEGCGLCALGLHHKECELRIMVQPTDGAAQVIVQGRVEQSEQWEAVCDFLWKQNIALSPLWAP